jgi:hypothetical protein
MATTEYGEVEQFSVWEESGDEVSVVYTTPFDVFVYGWSDDDGDPESTGPFIGQGTVLGVQVDEYKEDPMPVIDLVDVQGNRVQTIGLFFEIVPVDEGPIHDRHTPMMTYDEYMSSPMHRAS